jgi:hypothetical protein
MYQRLNGEKVVQMLLWLGFLMQLDQILLHQRQFVEVSLVVIDFLKL